jgi:aryl-alcohol dehydrogenase-like predicted oxidoreductase
MKSVLTTPIEGKAAYLGLSEISSTTLRRACAIHPISAVQVEYNPWALDIEGPSGTHLLNTCKELGVSLFAYSPLGRGIMTGKYRSTADFGPGDARAGMTRFQGDNFKGNLRLVDKLVDMARQKGCQPGQIAAAWIVAQGESVFVIPGTNKIRCIEENFGASWVEITEVENRRVRMLASAAEVGGGQDVTLGACLDTSPLNE